MSAEPTSTLSAAAAEFARRNAEQELGAYGVRVDSNEHGAIERRFRSDDRVNLYSVAKTFTAIAMLLAQHEGVLRLDDPFLDYLPELRRDAAEGLERVTIRQLLTMTSGSSHVWFADQPIDSLDLLRDFCTAELGHEPGRHFAYTGSGPYVAGRVLARATGANVRDYLMPRLFDPLDIHNPAWHSCPAGFPFAESDLFLRTEELARFSRLLLRRGRWHDSQVVPSSCVDALTAAMVDTSAITFGKQFRHGYG
jgi:CubicO group peptidase (beta-lactamase class C family)